MNDLVSSILGKIVLLVINFERLVVWIIIKSHVTLTLETEGFQCRMNSNA